LPFLCSVVDLVDSDVVVVVVDSVVVAFVVAENGNVPEDMKWRVCERGIERGSVFLFSRKKGLASIL